MNTLTHRLGGLLLGAAIVAVTGCVGDVDAPSTSTDGAPIASVVLDSGDVVDFLEPAPGVIVISSDAPVDLPDGPMAPVALYESLSGEAAPAALVEAQRRADEARAGLTFTGAGLEGVRPPARAEVAALSAADFAAAWCSPGGATFAYCWTNSTGNYEIDVGRVDWVHAHANMFSGSATLSMYRRDFWGNWDLIFSDTVTGWATVITQSTTDRDRYLIKMSNASGDTYHLSVHGAT
jgi:hypothetical protein